MSKSSNKVVLKITTEIFVIVKGEKDYLLEFQKNPNIVQLEEWFSVKVEEMECIVMVMPYLSHKAPDNWPEIWKFAKGILSVRTTK